DARVMQLPLQIADHNRAAVEHAGRESRIHAGLSKHRAEVLDGARAPGGHQRHLADLPHLAQLLDVITATHAIAPHAIEDQLARALVAISRRELHDIAHDPVVAKAHAFYDLPGAHVEAGNDASGKYGRSSSGVIRSSNSALPLTAAATPIRASARRSAALRTPPEACQASCGKRARAAA